MFVEWHTFARGVDSNGENTTQDHFVLVTTYLTLRNHWHIQAERINIIFIFSRAVAPIIMQLQKLYFLELITFLSSEISFGIENFFL